ncbi:MAG: TIGR03984 family CRISPR-associated protein [Chloroflexi bacterium]|nr:TIGR03984 family CRISPR-associated protein [Chloroflexota bacterium]
MDRLMTVNLEVETGIAVDARDGHDLREWFEQQGEGCTYFLAHADDGVIWGCLDQGRLLLSGDFFPEVSPALRPETLQQARLFGPTTELLVWSTRGGLAARRLREDSGEAVPCYDVQQILWGDRIEAQKGCFSLLREGEQGLRHAPPISSLSARRARLTVRNYIKTDASGQAYVYLSRLAGLSA